MITREEILQQQRRQSAKDRDSYDEIKAARHLKALNDALGRDEAERRIADRIAYWGKSAAVQAEFSAGQLKVQVVDELLTRQGLDPDTI